MLRYIGLATLFFFAPVGSFAEQIPRGLRCVFQSYPGHFSLMERNILRWKDGTEMLFDDGRVKSFAMRLQAPDLEDQVSIPYRPGKSYVVPTINFDPGRIRYEPFFLKMYGSSPNHVKAKLAPVYWLPETQRRKIWITSINGVDKKLQSISNELDRLSPLLKKYVSKISGTFTWRNIRGTTRLSPHSFGIAVDINADLSHYWMDHGRLPGNHRIHDHNVPMEIAEIFEKNSFIWGGKWYHYDTMHFEYRPELFCR
ncbi:MAG: M15 family metallopeptidase [Desulfobacterales bacterium]|nr:M15 family metallopeptidase [Desulfobacterales bacterium]